MIIAGGNGLPASTDIEVIIMSKAKEVTPPEAEVILTAGKKAEAPCPAGMEKIKYTMKGCRAYNPRVIHTQEAWNKVQAVMGVKQVATHEQLCNALATHFTRTEENHHDFIGYICNKIKCIALMA